MKHTSWQCHPMEPGETSQISKDPSSRAAATRDPSALVARATTAEGFHSTDLLRWIRSFSIACSDTSTQTSTEEPQNRLERIILSWGDQNPQSHAKISPRESPAGNACAPAEGFKREGFAGDENPFIIEGVHVLFQQLHDLSHEQEKTYFCLLTYVTK